MDDPLSDFLLRQQPPAGHTLAVDMGRATGAVTVTAAPPVETVMVAGHDEGFNGEVLAVQVRR